MRQRALAALVEPRVPGFVPDLRGLIDDPTLRGPVLRALAAYDDPATPEVILNHYPRFAEPERSDAIATLAARPSWALASLDAIERGRIPRHDLSVSVPASCWPLPIHAFVLDSKPSGEKSSRPRQPRLP